MVLEQIQKLVFDHDCVIIPDFGGLITHYEPASIHPIRHTFLPPAKRVAFNEKLQLNDGLLISTLAYDQQLPTEEAQARVIQFVHQLQNDLHQSRRCDLQGIGIFRLNSANKVAFEYVRNENYLPDAFGLPELISPPIAAAEPVMLRTLRKEHAMPAPRGFKNRIRRYYRALAALVVGGVAVTGLYLLSQQTDYNLSAINPLALFQAEPAPVTPTATTTAASDEPTATVPATSPENQPAAFDESFPPTDGITTTVEFPDLPASSNPVTAAAPEEPFKGIITEKAQGIENPKKLTIGPGEAVLISAKGAEPSPTAAVQKNATDAKDDPKEVKRNFTTEEINAALAAGDAKPQPAITNAPTNAPAANQPVAPKENAAAPDRANAPVAAAATPAKAERFYVIVNGYATYANAERNRKIIAKKGRPGQIIAPFGEATLYRIAIAEYETRTQAVRNLPQLKKTYGNTIWILKR